jgi:branched-chain amino acid transport system substrate-binding protein
VGGNGLNTPNLFPVCKAQCDGIIVAQAYSYETANDVNKAFRDAYKADQKKEPGQFPAQAFTAVQIIAEALKAVDSKSKLSGMSLDQMRSELNKQLLSGMKFTTPLGDISLDSEGEIQQNQFYIAQIKMDADGKNGAFVFMKD